MSKSDKSITAYKDDTLLYASNSKALKEQRKRDRQKERDKRRSIRISRREEKKAEKQRRKSSWKNTKKNLYNQAMNTNFYNDAEYHLMNNRTYYNEKDVLKYEKKLKRKHYRRLVREARKFR